MIAGGGVADEGAVDGGWRRENFAGGKIGPIARTDEAAGFDPVEAAIEMGGEFCAGFGLYGEGFGAEHAVAELVAEAVDHAVIGAHALLHDFGSYADHVGVADLAALDDFDDGHARGEFAGLRVHAEDADVGGFEGFEYRGGGGFYRAGSGIFEGGAGARGVGVFDGGGGAGGFGGAGPRGDGGGPFARV